MKMVESGGKQKQTTFRKKNNIGNFFEARDRAKPATPPPARWGEDATKGYSRRHTQPRAAWADGLLGLPRGRGPRGDVPPLQECSLVPLREPSAGVCPPPNPTSCISLPPNNRAGGSVIGTNSSTSGGGGSVIRSLVLSPIRQKMPYYEGKKGLGYLGGTRFGAERSIRRTRGKP